MSGMEEAMRSMVREEMRDTLRTVIREELSTVRIALTAPRTESARVATLEKTFTTTQVAEHLQVDPSTVRSWLMKGVMEGSKATGHWLVTATQLSAFKVREKARTSKAAPNSSDEAARLLGSLL